jgi:surface antigen
MSKLPRTLRALSTATLFAVGVGSAHAANLNFLHDTPMSYMTQQDYASITNAVRDAVANKPDGESATWTNEGTRNAVKIDATITPTNTEKNGDTTCRNTDVVINAKGQTMTLHPRFCRIGTADWKYQKPH